MEAAQALTYSRDSREYRQRWRTLAVLSLSLVIIGLDNTILNVALPTLQREFDASASALQWMVDAYVLVFAGLLLTMGALGDRYGRARALRAGLLVFGGASALAAYSGSEGQLIAMRALMGAGGALIMPATLSIVTNVFPREERARAIGIWAAMAALGIGTGPMIGGFLLDHFWWGSVFLINIPVVGAALAGGAFLVPESSDPARPPLDIPGALLSTAAIAVLVYGIIEAPSRGWTDALVLLGFGGAIALAIAFALRELTTPYPMLQLAFFKNPRFSMGAGAIGIAFFALFGTVFGMTQYLQFVHGYSPLGAGVRLAPVSLGMMFAASNAPRLVARFGTKRVVTGGLLVLGGVLTAVNLWGIDSPYWVILVTILALSQGMGNVMTPSTDAVMGAVPLGKAGVGSAMNDVTRQVGGALGVAVIGSVMNSVYSSKMADLVAGLSPAAAAAARDNVGAATQIAARLPGEAGPALAHGARVAFLDAFGMAVFAGTAVAVVGAVLVFKFMPARHLAPQWQPGQPIEQSAGGGEPASAAPASGAAEARDAG